MVHLIYHDILYVIKAGERTAGALEAWNVILKRQDHPQHQLRPDVF